MGASHSRDDSLLDSEDEASPDASPHQFHSPPASQFHSPSLPVHQSPSNSPVHLKLDSLSLNPSSSPPLHASQQAKLYQYLGGSTPKARWIVVQKFVGWAFVRDGDDDDDSEDDDSLHVDESKSFRSWILSVGNKVRARVDARLQMKFVDDQLRADFIHEGVWALKFLSVEGYKDFVSEYMNCKFENTYLLEATEENKMKVFGKDFIGWDKPEEADESVWEDADDTFEPPPQQKLKEAFTEPSSGGIQSLTMGALDHSFLVSDAGVEAVRNLSSGIQGKGVAVQFGKSLGVSDSYSTPKKAMLMRGETNMMLLSPGVDTLHSSGVHQLDIGTGKVVAEWKFEKDGTPITMRDVTNESKGAQLDPTGSTFLGLDDNRLCRWDMRDRHGVVQDIVSPVLNWAAGHQFARGTSFQCFATTGDGCVVVGSKDGKVRLYGTSSMRMAKTAFPGLGLPITHVDVTFDGKWVLATTDAYLILISTVFKDKDGKSRTGFSGRAGNKFAAPRLLKLTPLDAHLAGKNHKLRGGQFSWVTESGKQERHLVATAGMFTIIWNFRRVKESKHECYRHAAGLKSCYCYKIVPKEESVVDSKFMHDNYTTSSPEAPLVVATPKNVSSFNIWRD